MAEELIKPEPVKKSGAGALVWILIVILILAVVAGAYLLWKQNDRIEKLESQLTAQTTTVSTTTTTPTATTATTAEDPYNGWKEYVDKNGKFSIKYPSDWTLEDSSMESYVASFISPLAQKENKAREEGPAEGCSSQIYLSAYEGLRDINRAYENPAEAKNATTLYEWLVAMQTAVDGRVSNLATKTIAEKTGYKFTMSNAAGYCESYVEMVQNGDNIYAIEEVTPSISQAQRTATDQLVFDSFKLLK